MTRKTRAKNDRLRPLRALTIFADLTDEELLHIDQQTTTVMVQAGRRLMVEGSQGRDCMIVVEGTARVTQDGTTIAEIGPGEMIGEMALLNEGKRSATVTALTPMRLMVLHRGEFAEMLRVSSSVRARVEAMAQLRSSVRPTSGEAPTVPGVGGSGRPGGFVAGGSMEGDSRAGLDFA